jgi:hypothetical protein
VLVMGWYVDPSTMQRRIQLVPMVDDAFSAKEMDRAISECKRLHTHNVSTDRDSYCSACCYLDPKG